jgi:ribose-phosphate pyrophosphokinase
MADAARRASAGKITAVIPYFGYARQDRKDKSRVPISAKLVMDLVAAAGFDRVVTMDLHAAQVGGFTNLPFDHLSFKPSLIAAIKEHNLDIDVVVSPDIGAVKRSTEYADSLKKDLAIIAKKRLTDVSVEVKHFIGDVNNKKILIVDDLTESVGTLLEAAKACKEQGAKEINVAVTHGCFSESGIKKLKEGVSSGIFTRFFHSNTVANTFEETGMSNSIISVDVSPVFATAIKRIHNNESVSELFEVV